MEINPENNRYFKQESEPIKYPNRNKLKNRKELEKTVLQTGSESKKVLFFVFKSIAVSSIFSEIWYLNEKNYKVESFGGSSSKFCYKTEKIMKEKK